MLVLHRVVVSVSALESRRKKPCLLSEHEVPLLSLLNFVPIARNRGLPEITQSFQAPEKTKSFWKFFLGTFTN
jgi:hypothetical protein